MSKPLACPHCTAPPSLIEKIKNGWLCNACTRIVKD